ncbi:hypothetical protein H5410_004705, partial [Solanum commersonii]
MFVDEETENFLRNSSELDHSMRIGLWRIVVVHNLPYDDPRRNGKSQSFCCTGFSQMPVILYGLMQNLSLLWIHIKYLK